jgi:outer membrane immunogenic protein
MMKRLALMIGGIVSTALFATGTLAADLQRPAYKAQPSYVAPYYSWSGFYVGINGGYGWGKSSWDPTGFAGTGDFTVKGPLVGATLGYNLQTGSFVWGLEADADISWIKGTTTTGFCGVPGCETSNRWLATGRGRIG